MLNDQSPNPPSDPNDSASDRVSRLRRDAGQHSFPAFLKIYLGNHCTIPPSSMHLDIFALLEAATVKRGERIAIAAPRGHAKTTLVNTAYLLWCICYKKEDYILLGSSTSDNANDMLSHIKKELMSNPLLIEDFPEVCEIPNVPPKSERWRRGEIITRNDVKVTAFGAGTSIRGRKHQEHRPSLILMDDLEIRERVFSEDQRAKTSSWFHGAVCKLGSATTNIIVVGTILHYDSLLCQLTDPKRSPGWTSRIYKAVISWAERVELWSDWENLYRSRTEFEGATGPGAAEQFLERHREEMLRGTRVLWPEHESYEALMVIRERENRATFDSEKQNEPINPTDCLFPDSEMQFWDDEFDSEDALFTALGRNGIVIGACDPSLGRAGKLGNGSAWDGGAGGGDYSAIVMLLWDIEKMALYVLDADIRRRKPDIIIEDVLNLYKHRNCCAFAFETNGFQQLLGGQLLARARERHMLVSMNGVVNTTDKRGRIQRLQPMVRSGQIKFCRRHTLLLEQLRQFPMGTHDDGPDALEMAVRLAEGMCNGEVSPPRSPDYSPYDYSGYQLTQEDIWRFESNLLAEARRQGMRI